MINTQIITRFWGIYRSKCDEVSQLPLAPGTSIIPSTKPAARPDMVSFSKLAFPGPICTEILRHLSPAEICRFQKVSQGCRVSAISALTQVFNIHSRLLYFFKDPNSFRLMQSETGAIISGSFALQFFQRSFYPEADLDLYVVDSAKHIAGDWLLSNDYIFSPSPTTPNSTLQPATYQEALDNMDRNIFEASSYVRGVMGVLDFLRETQNGTRKVQLVIVDVCPMVAVMNFHSSTLTFFYNNHS